jgi:hypothetical protein
MSGRVRDAFIKRGHDAISCDFLPSLSPGPHLRCNVLDILSDGWDMMIAFPPCTYLCSSGARWWKDRQYEQGFALLFVRCLMNAPIERICIENPVGIISTKIGAPDQIIHPWWFGHGETKTTCLWLKNLPLLKPTNIVIGRENRIHKMSQTRDRGLLRSITYQGIADAMADQWGAAE